MIEAKTIKDKLKRELIKVFDEINNEYYLSDRYPFLFEATKEYIFRESKMLRPILMVIIYSSYANKITKDIIRSALGFELLHNCALIHDDIIDDSKFRRGGLALHNLYDSMSGINNMQQKTGKDLALISGDIFYALGLKYFMEIKTDKKLKEKAINNILDTAIKTGLGEFGEIVLMAEDIKKIKKEKIMQIYDLKTSYYTLISPMYTGAILAKALKKDCDILKLMGSHIGRAFQIKNDIKDLDSKSNRRFEDIKMKTRNILLYYAYNNSNDSQTKLIESIYNKENPSEKDCLAMANIYEETNTLKLARKEIEKNIKKAFSCIEKLEMDKNKKDNLKNYFTEVLKA